MAEGNGGNNSGGLSMAVVLRGAGHEAAARWSEEQVNTIRWMAASGAKSVAQLSAFLAIAAKYDLDPLAKEIWLVDMGGRQGVQVVVGRDAYLKIARRYPEYGGYIGGVVHAKDVFEVIRDGGDRVEIKHGIAGFDRGPLVGAYCVVRVQGRPDVYIQRTLDDYKHLQGKDNWRQYPEDMLETRCIMAAHRRAFSLSGLYHESEFGDPQAGTDGANEEARAATEANTQSLASSLRERVARAQAGASDARGEPEDIVDAELVDEETGEIIEHDGGAALAQ